jgi:hypothetical protein
MPRANDLSREEPIPAPPVLPARSNATRTIVSTLGMRFVVSGLNHGLLGLMVIGQPGLCMTLRDNKLNSAI